VLQAATQAGSDKADEADEEDEGSGEEDDGSGEEDEGSAASLYFEPQKQLVHATDAPSFCVTGPRNWVAWAGEIHLKCPLAPQPSPHLLLFPFPQLPPPLSPSPPAQSITFAGAANHLHCKRREPGGPEPAPPLARVPPISAGEMGE